MPERPEPLADPVGALVPGPPVQADGAPDGPLAGLTFAATDLLDVAGHVTGAGNPDWRRTHPAASRSAAAVEALLDAGATLAGRTVTDELGLGVLGVNPHDGTPANPVAPDSVPGGSSSGSAAAVAAGMVDLALGADATGSVRVPAALCGVHGFRPSFGAVPVRGLVPTAPSFDTVGWLARDSTVLWQAATALLGPPPVGDAPHAQLLVAEELWEAADDEVVDALFPAVQRLAVRLRTTPVVQLTPDGLAAWSDAATTLAAHEVWSAHGDWLSSTNPVLSLDTKARLDLAAAVTDAQATAARAARDQATTRLAALLAADAVLALPTVPEIAPLLDSDDGPFADFRRRTEVLTCIAGLGGLPQVTVPVASLAEYPVGLSLIGAAGSDHRLLALAATVAPG